MNMQNLPLYMQVASLCGSILSVESAGEENRKLANQIIEKSLINILQLVTEVSAEDAGVILT